MIKMLKETNKFVFWLVYICCLFFAGFFFYEYGTSIGIVLVFGLIFLAKRQWRFFSRRSVIVFLFFTTNLFLSDLWAAVSSVTNLNLKILFANIMFFLVSLLISNTINYREYMKAFVAVVVLIAIVSTLLYVVANIDFSIITRLPAVTNSSRRKGYFALFSIVSDFRMAGAQRSQGIFWEPGAYQVILCMAYIFETARKENPRKWVITLLLVAMLTTVSTTGIFTAVLLLTYSLSSKKGNMSLVKTLIIVTIMLIVVSYVLANVSGFLKYTLVDKIDMLKNYQIGTATDASSRVDSIIFPLKGLLNSPILGIGAIGLEELYYVTCTPINWFAQCGVIFGVVIVRGLLLFFNKIFKNKVNAIVLFLILCFSMMTEAFESNVLVLCLVFWGYKLQNDKELQENSCC